MIKDPKVRYVSSCLVTLLTLTHFWSFRKVHFPNMNYPKNIISDWTADYKKPALLELGGGAVFIVLEDADLKLAAKNAIFGGFFTPLTTLCLNWVLGEYFERNLALMFDYEADRLGSARIY